MEFEDKFIGFIDILGFKQMVAAAERGEGLTLPQILALTAKLGRVGEREQFEKHGGKMCPQATYLRRDLDFRATQISDCVVISTEISPAGGINLINQAWLAVTELIARGVLCRGYITRGKIYHTESQFIGTGYQKAYHKGENEVKAFSRHADDLGTPFVEIDSEVRDYLAQSPDACVREMFSRLVKDDGTVAALFPFQQFCSKFAITADFDAAMQKKSNDNLRVWLHSLRERILYHLDRNNAKAVMKTEHYIAALDAQFEICDRTDHLIDALGRPFPGPR
jgi:hypothetical protein